MAKRGRRSVSAPRAAQVVALAVAAVLVLGFSAYVVLHQPEQPRGRDFSDELASLHEASVEAARVDHVVLLGDSYSVGTGSSDGKGLLDDFAAGRSWSVTNLARGGTGYGTSVDGALAQKACGARHCASYTELIEKVGDLHPDVVVVSGGRNDVNSPQVEQAVQRFYAELRATLPNATIYATSPLWDSTKPPAELAAVETAVKRSAAQIGGRYVYLGQPLVGHPDLISSDQIHPNDRGYDALTAVLASRWPAS